MVYNIEFKSAKIINKDLSKIPTIYRIKIIDNIKSLSLSWFNNYKVKKLNHYYLCDYRLRVWDYRILFNLDKDKILIFRVLHRSKLY